MHNRAYLITRALVRSTVSFIALTAGLALLHLPSLLAPLPVA